MSEHAKCPFCGGEAELHPASDMVRCGNIEGCEQDEWLSLEQWDQRPIEDALRAQLAEAAYLLRKCEWPAWAEMCQECGNHMPGSEEFGIAPDYVGHADGCRFAAWLAARIAI